MFHISSRCTYRMPALWIHFEMYPLFFWRSIGWGVSTGTPLYCKNQPDTKPTGRWGQKSSQISVAGTQTMKNKQTDEEETVTFRQMTYGHLHLRLRRYAFSPALWKQLRSLCQGKKTTRSSERYILYYYTHTQKQEHWEEIWCFSLFGNWYFDRTSFSTSHCLKENE